MALAKLALGRWYYVVYYISMVKVSHENGLILMIKWTKWSKIGQKIESKRREVEPVRQQIRNLQKILIYPVLSDGFHLPAIRLTPN